MAKRSIDSKWEGKVIAELRSATADQVWPFIEDFCSLDRWFPGVASCRQVKGVYGQPGLIRHVTTTPKSPPPPPPSDNSDQPPLPETVVRWCYETLLSIDPIQRCLSYQITENNFGVGFYVAEWKAIDETKGGGGGCRIEWRFTADPMEGQTLEGFCDYTQASLKVIGERMEKALQDNLK